MSEAIVSDGKVVEFHYVLKDGDGNMIDSSEGYEPLAYLHGAGNIVPGLEALMVGKMVGDSFNAVVPPAEGYGEREGPGPQRIPKDQFPPDFPISVGMQFIAEGPDGEDMPLWVVDIDGDDALIDMNHPLAGVTLHFDVTIASIRDAEEEELDHGHPHTADHDHDH